VFSIFQRILKYWLDVKLCERVICPTSDFCEFLSSPLAKNILLPFFKIMIIVTLSHPGKRGERVVTNVGRDAMDALCVARRAA
ncbi:MAG TPA: hypothetical protein VH157_17275, partial [Bryobacteraceae bacterium]|nr:hypothetical protein [Bryobacteraceae bacterium]